MTHWSASSLAVLAVLGCPLLGGLVWAARGLARILRRQQADVERLQAAIGEVIVRLAGLERLSAAQGWADRGARNRQVAEVLRGLKARTLRLRGPQKAAERVVTLGGERPR